MTNSFLAAQAADPFDPTPMLIHADWLEEHGDAAGAAVLRALVASELPSLHALALQATLVPMTYQPDRFMRRTWDEDGTGTGLGDGDDEGGEEGSGAGRKELSGNMDRRTETEGCWSGIGGGDGNGFIYSESSSDAIGMGFGCESGYGHEERDESQDEVLSPEEIGLWPEYEEREVAWDGSWDTDA